MSAQGTPQVVAPQLVGFPLPQKLAQALAKAQDSVEDVPRDGYNKKHDFHYTRADTMVKAGKKALRAAGLLLAPLDTALRATAMGGEEPAAPAAPSAAGARPTRGVVLHDLVRKVALVHPESGEQVVCFLEWALFLQQGKLGRDKAEAMACTSQLAYFLRDLLQIDRLLGPSDDAEGARGDEDSEPEEEERPQRKPDPRPAAAAAAPAARATAAAASPAPRASTSARTSASAGSSARPTTSRAAPAAGQGRANGRAASPASSSRPSPTTTGTSAASASTPGGATSAPAGAASSGKAEARAAEAKLATDPAPAAGYVPGIGQTYGGEAAPADAPLALAEKDLPARGAQAAEAQREWTPEEEEAAVLRLLQQGYTPSRTDGSFAGDLLPSDPSVDDLVSFGWGEDSAQVLAALPEGEPVPRETLNGVCEAARQLLGVTQAEGRKRFVAVFAGLGVDMGKKQVPNGYQLRLFARLAADSAQEAARAREEEEEAPVPEAEDAIAY